MQCVSICGASGSVFIWKNMTYWGVIPNIRADMSNVMTPKKKETFSRVRTTFADCHDAASVVIRVESCWVEKNLRRVKNYD